jgi:hypothetical protein
MHAVAVLQVCFRWVWCQGACEEATYAKGLRIVWRVLVCITLWSTANFLKVSCVREMLAVRLAGMRAPPSQRSPAPGCLQCCIARLLSYSFYRTAHFAKVKEAIERVSAPDLAAAVAWRAG